MSYEKTIWVKDDIVTADKLNKIEGQLESVDQNIYTKPEIDAKLSATALITDIKQDVVFQATSLDSLTPEQKLAINEQIDDVLTNGEIDKEKFKNFILEITLTGNKYYYQCFQYFMIDGIATLYFASSQTKGTITLYVDTLTPTNSYIQNIAFYSNNSNTTFSRNTAIGYNVLYSSGTGSFNTAMGYTALYSNTGDGNTAIGCTALYSNETGDTNTAIGYNALYSNETGNQNTAIGCSALRYHTTGSKNTALGQNAGSYGGSGSTRRTTGSNSVFIGYDSKASANDVSNEIVIGYNAVGKGANTVTLGNANVTNAYVGNNRILTETDIIPLSKIDTGSNHTDILIGTQDGSIGTLPQATFAPASHQHTKSEITDFPTISTNITTDATSDIKTTSPKAVKSYVDNAISTAIGDLLGGES